MHHRHEISIRNKTEAGLENLTGKKAGKLTRKHEHIVSKERYAFCRRFLSGTFRFPSDPKFAPIQFPTTAFIIPCIKSPTQLNPIPISKIPNSLSNLNQTTNLTSQKQKIRDHGRRSTIRTTTTTTTTNGTFLFSFFIL